MRRQREWARQKVKNLRYSFFWNIISYFIGERRRIGILWREMSNAVYRLRWFHRCNGLKCGRLSVFDRFLGWILRCCIHHLTVRERIFYYEDLWFARVSSGLRIIPLFYFFDLVSNFYNSMGVLFDFLLESNVHLQTDDIYSYATDTMWVIGDFQPFGDTT